jgi:hypothetical protein
MATNINGNDGSGVVIGVLLALLIVGLGAWGMGIIPFKVSKSPDVVVNVPAEPAAPAPAPSSGDGTSN